MEKNNDIFKKVIIFYEKILSKELVGSEISSSKCDSFSFINKFL